MDGANHRKSCFLALVALLAGCQAAAPEQPIDAKPHPSVMAVPMEQTRQIGRSVEGRPIELHLLGSGPRPVLVIGGIHGNERNASACAQSLLEYLHSHPADLAGNSVAIITTANPDGLDRNLRFNAHRVDLNRNFPATNWSRTYASGTTPGSEPETKALVALLNELKPSRILSIHSHTTDPCNNFDGPASKLALAMTQHNGYPTMASIGYPTPGSLGSWAGIDRNIPIVTLEMPAALAGPPLWDRNRDAILGFVRGEQ